MDFGKVVDIDAVDFNFANRSKENTTILDNAPKVNEPTIYIGCAKWGRKDWVGKLYPSGTKEKEYLGEYAKHFNSIELNATHYNIPKPEWIERWREQVGEDFKFCPKVHQGISHWGRLANIERYEDAFMQCLERFGNNLGSVFLQLPPNFAPKSIDALKDYVSKFPKDVELFVELRHKLWFEEELMNDLTQFFNDNNIGWVITDTSGRRDVCHMRLSNPNTFVRFVGNSLHKTDYTRIDDWVCQSKTWIEGGLNKLYFFMHQHEELHSPQLCAYLIEKLNAELGTNVKAPQLISQSQQGDLF